MNDLRQIGESNVIDIPSNFKLNGLIRGERNYIKIEHGSDLSSLQINISGNDNIIKIGRGHIIKGLRIVIGSHIPAHETSINIGNSFSVEPNTKFLVYNSGNKLSFGDGCMLSNSITVRCGEQPHLIFDSLTGEYLDKSKGVSFGNHVWIGEQVYVTKSGGSNDDCIIGACSVLTKSFDETQVAIAGNPAKIIRRNIKWVRNHTLLEKESKEYDSLQNFHAAFQRNKN